MNIFDRKELEKLEKRQLIETIVMLASQVKNLALEVSELKAKLNMNSGNSGKPPSADGPGVPKPKSLREKSGKSAGGQPGHEGRGLKLEREPDETVEHKAESCAKCGAEIQDVEGSCAKTSNVIDIEIRAKIVRHEQIATECPECGASNVGEMPAEASHEMAYGSGLRAFVVLMSNYACVGMKKISGLLGDVFGVPISAGTVSNMNAGFGERAEPIVAEIRARAQESPVLHVDETGMSVNGENWWLHNASTGELTYVTAHRKRGFEGIDAGGVLPDYVGVVVHDFWAPYFRYGEITHAMCCAHLLRELRWVEENTNQTWASEMATLLIKMKLAKEECQQNGIAELPERHAMQFARDYAEILALGDFECPYHYPSRKQPKARNLLERFIDHMDEITRFARDFDVPFTNNQAERDIRNAKVKQKVSGCFRSDDGIANFAKISSVIGTAAKQGLSVFNTLKDILAGKLSSLFSLNSLPTE
jgi:transposase